MEFGFGIHTSEGVNTNFLLKLEQELKGYFINKNYGVDVQKIIIGICCMAEEFENFYKKKKPSFTPYKEFTVVNKKIIIDRVFEYEIWLDFKTFQSQKGKEENLKYIASEILNSLSKLDALPKKVKDFDKEQFKADMEQFFKISLLTD